MGRFAFVAIGLAVAAAVLAPGAGAQTTREVTVDFTDAGEGPLVRDFYFPLGLVLSSDSFVSQVGGDEAVQGTLSGQFNAPVSALAVDVAPAFAGFTNVTATGRITLTAFDAGSVVIASESIERTTDTAAGTGLDYVTIDLGVLPRPATSFVITGGGLEVQAPDYGISCSSTDASCIYFFGTSELRFTIEQTDTDTVAPLIGVPGAIEVNATGPDGARVDYVTRVRDDVDPNPQLSCEPASGSVFPIGTTTVTCTARDASGNSSQESFDVTVRGPAPDRSKDYVVGFGSVFGAQEFEVSVEADRDGTNVSGTASGTGAYNFVAQATCLTIVGNRASIGFELTQGFETLGRGLLISYLDNGDGMTPDQILNFEFMPEPPQSCPPPPSTNEGSLAVEGDVDIHDAPVLPTSKDQCKNGGWRTFPGFKNQGDCVSFVATGGKNPPGG